MGIGETEVSFSGVHDDRGMITSPRNDLALSERNYEQVIPPIIFRPS
jgi:hypothetical protein